jgi:CO/xanthine dehydrogenase Mo-binding subunit
MRTGKWRRRSGFGIFELTAAQKVTGQARFGVDLTAPAMLNARLLYSAHPHARILAIDRRTSSRARGGRAPARPVAENVIAMIKGERSPNLYSPPSAG